MDKKAHTIFENLMGSNLVVVFSTVKTLKGDIAKMHSAIDLCPEFSRFNVLWILHRTGKEVKSGDLG